ncbi:MAG TPA: hypothetical protein PK668_26675 [Myxococcota bacterium]|nr:hypothetical protein [Myxococcota bacterium]HRY97114.1 hypothetical protein [Myxococcota bacterium]HSA23174.1 hypothetical protein [Myxococcota bacterium]
MIAPRALGTTLAGPALACLLGALSGCQAGTVDIPWDGAAGQEEDGAAGEDDGLAPEDGGDPQIVEDDGGEPADDGWEPLDEGAPQDESPPDPCAGVTCSGHGTCRAVAGAQAECACEAGYVAAGLECVPDTDDCTGQTCSGHGTCHAWPARPPAPAAPVCACDGGYTPSTRAGLDCVPTSQICVGGAIDYDIDVDGVNDTWFEPNEYECLQFELVNLTRATHDPEGTDECHHPLGWSVEWAAHGRNHSVQMERQGQLFHADYPYCQNCAYGCDPACEMDMYMTGANEGHCPPLSHHCNIMRCGTSQIGIGYSGTFNTQNIF